LEELDVVGKMILKWILGKYGGKGTSGEFLINTIMNLGVP